MEKIINSIEEVREYVQKDYWENGKTKGCSGYEDFNINWDWNNRLTEALETVYDFNNKVFLDLGCAYGQVVASMIKKGYNAYGIDISDYAINAGRKEYPPLSDKIIQGSAHELTEYPSEHFDFIYSNQVFEHIPGKVCPQLAEEIFRVAKPGAILWAGLVLDICSDFQPQAFNPEDPDKTHINLRPKLWWDNIFTSKEWQINFDFDKAFRKHKVSDGYSFFEEYGWHSICYKKK